MSASKIPPRRRRALAVVALITAAVAAACGDSTGPGGNDSPPVDQVAVSGVSLDPTAFRSAGSFSLGVVPTGTDGKVLLNDKVQISAAISAGTAGYSLTVVSNAAQPASSRPIAAALDIDNSGSMSSSDPQRIRRSASKLFWDAVLGARSTNQVALADFGAGRTTGFANTRLLEGWGRDTVRLVQRLDSMVASGGTPLYESAVELLRWVDTTRAASGFDRVMVLMTDGQPNGDGLRDSAAALARARGITIHTVGLGEASDANPRSANAAAVLRVRELAYRTGGVYAAANSAAALDTIFRTIARVSSAGQFLTAFRVSPVPPSGTVISGTVTVAAGGASRQAVWSLVAP